MEENCIMKDVVNSMSQILVLLGRIIDHCEKCLEKSGKNDKQG